MRPTWIVARAAVRRRRTQTVLIGVIVTLCTATLLVGMALLNAVSGPFDRTFAQLNGAHLTVQFDGAKITADQVAATGRAAGVTASDGPHPVAMASLVRPDGEKLGGPMRIIGRSTPDGGVDKLELTHGRWPTATNEIVIGSQYRFGPETESPVGRRFTLPVLGEVTIVGVGYSVTRTGDVWMLPDAVRQIGVAGYEMLYRFAPDSTGTAAQMTQHTAAVTAGLPADAVSGTSSYLTMKEQAGQNAKTISTFLTVFAVLSVLVAILVIGNVVSGAVLAGFRSIGVMKAVGFTPGQVTGAYLLMMTGPAVVGSIIGAVLGNFGTMWMLGQFQNNYVLGLTTTAPPWVTAATVVAMLALVALTALVPALRAGRQSATTALSARTSQTGRGRGTQRLLSRSRLPRSVSLGLALPVIRPARTLMTLMAIVLGSATVVFSIGLLSSANQWDDAITRLDHIQATVVNPPPDMPAGMEIENGRRQPSGTVMTEQQVETFLRGVTGVKHITSVVQTDVSVAGLTSSGPMSVLRGDSAHLGYELLEGRWFQGAGEAVVGTPMLKQTGKKVGDELVLFIEGRTITVTIVGEIFLDERELFVDAATVPNLEQDKRRPAQFHIGLASGTTAQQFIDRVAEGGNGGLIAFAADDDGIGLVELTVVIGTLTALLLVVAGLGVAHTVVLNTRERRRDLAVVKAVGMTPGQVIIMGVTSMAVLGLIGGALGLPGGVAAQRWIIGRIGDSEGVRLPGSIIDVYAAGELAVLLLCGLLIAVLGALLPAQRAARVSTAEALHTE